MELLPHEHKLLMKSEADPKIISGSRQLLAGDRSKKTIARGHRARFNRAVHGPVSGVIAKPLGKGDKKERPDDRCKS
jgi:hypothetical protein